MVKELNLQAEKQDNNNDMDALIVEKLQRNLYMQFFT